MARVFLTGVTGFAGSHLADSLLRDGHDVFGLVHPASGHQPLPEDANFQAIEGDLSDLGSIIEAFAEADASVVYHLGGLASPALSWEDPAFTMAINTGGTANVLQAAVESGRPRVIVVTSALLYGSLEETDLPIDEQTPPTPSHPYAVSKWAASILSQLYWKRYDLPVIEARPFNHIGPRQMLGFVVPDFASQIAEIEIRGLRPIVEVGNLDAERDFTDVRDIVLAYRRLAETGVPGETYLICSGMPVSVRQILNTLIEVSGIEVEVIEDPDRFRPLETRSIYGTFAKIHRDTGWEPRIPLRQSLADAYGEWRDYSKDEQE